MYYFNYEYFLYLTLWFIFVWKLDNILKMYIITSARYFVLHTIVNIIIVCMSYKDMLLFLIDPVPKLNYVCKETLIASSLIVSFHIHHYIFGKLDFETKIHHIIGGIMCGLVPWLASIGNIAGCCNFIMCGFPGAVDYICLTAYKYDKVSKIFEKNINRWLNLLIRMPGMMFISISVFQQIYLNNIRLQDNKILVSGILLALINAVYYCNKTVGNYHVHVFQLSNSNKRDKLKNE